MAAMSPVFAALGVVEFDVLNDLSHWLDGPVAPMAAAEKSEWLSPARDRAILVADQSAGREG
jgi:hypothetical protein